MTPSSTPYTHAYATIVKVDDWQLWLHKDNGATGIVLREDNAKLLLKQLAEMLNDKREERL